MNFMQASGLGKSNATNAAFTTGIDSITVDAPTISAIISKLRADTTYYVRIMAMFLLILVISALLIPSVSSREWVAKNGRKTQGDFVKLESAVVHIAVSDGKTKKIKFEFLSDADQDYVKSQATKNETILSKTNPKKYRVRISLELKSVGVRPDILIGELALPESNEYQTIQRLEHSPGRVLSYPENGEKYLCCRFHDDACPQPGSSASIFHEFEATLYDITVDFSKIDEIYPYKKKSPLYRHYTGQSGEMIDPTHPEIIRIAKQIASTSKDPLEYARNAYLYVSENYKYLNPNTGIASLNTLLENGGGDCGNLSSIYISLLRNRGIPARHLFTIRPDGSYHVWADFYLEKYGWIPVDVTYRLLDESKSHDFFGRVRVESNGIILSRDVDLSVMNHLGDLHKVVHMQTFAYWWVPDNSGMSGHVECHHSLNAQPIE